MPKEFAFSKAQSAEVTGLVAGFDQASSELGNAIEKYNDEPKWSQFDVVLLRIKDYNNARSLLVDKIDSIAEEMQGKFDDKSESWQEGDTGQAVSEWISSLENVKEELEELGEPSYVDGDELDIAHQSSQDFTLEDEPEGA